MENSSQDVMGGPPEAHLKDQCGGRHCPEDYGFSSVSYQQDALLAQQSEDLTSQTCASSLLLKLSVVNDQILLLKKKAKKVVRLR